MVNTQCESLFGYKREELINKPIELLIPERFAQHKKYRDKYIKKPRLRMMGANLELFGRRKDGTEFPVEISLSPLETEEGVLVSAAVRDITNRKNEGALVELFIPR